VDGSGTHWWRGLLRLALVIAALAAILFGAAGRLDWLAAWVLVGLYAAYLLAVMAWGLRHAPELLAERGRVAANVKTWDKIVNALYAILIVLLLVVAGLDAGRYRWSSMALALQLAGLLGLMAAGWAIWWCIATNAYASRWARIQEDRGQHVVSSGPYRIVRHPMYTAIILLVFCLALELGSWWSLLPAGLIAALFVVRTALEDRMLHEELSGYRAYASQVRHRLLPGIW
jgi:protein-S-isoprenylcysteine O-methyltransferase Ste14